MLNGKYILGCLVLLFLAACNKTDTFKINNPQYQVGQAVSDSAPLSGNIRGTMLRGKTYAIAGDVTIQAGDTLFLQDGVTVNVGAGKNIIVKGVLLSLGTSGSPNYFTVKGITKTDVQGKDIFSDTAYKGLWGGILCDTSCKLLVIKWTHIEYTGSALVTPPVYGTTAGASAWSVFFQNVKGTFVMEDSWIYGTVVDALRVNGAHLHVMRNTFAKIGLKGAEGANIKGSTVGDVAYNLVMGCGQNGLKATNNGAGSVQCNINMYNNTILNSGWKTNQIGRGGSINFEEGASGRAYNNIIVNCRFGLRVVKTPPADTANLFYGYNYYYGDRDTAVNQFYPVNYISRPQATDFPNPFSYLPANYQLGSAYSNTGLAGANNPRFVNYPFPVTGLFQDISFVSGLNFRLLPNSPAIGRGYTSFAPLAKVPVDARFGATEITLPGQDMGAYQYNGAGNQH